MRRATKVFGLAVSVLVTGWVLYRYGGRAPGVDLADAAVWRNLAGATALYVFVLLIGATVWRILLVSFGERPGRWAAESQLLTAQIGKYLPGNVAHLAGRVALSVKDGASPTAAGLALVAETVLVVATGLTLALVGLWLLPGVGAAVGDAFPAADDLMVAGGLLAAALAGVLVGATLLRRYGLLEPLARLGLRSVLLVLLLHSVTFGVLGVSLQLVTGFSASAGAAPFSFSMVVFAAAWVAGLVTPGAPGGLGVRESVITLGLGVVIGEPAALTAALLHRGVSVAGDVVAFGIGCALRGR